MSESPNPIHEENAGTIDLAPSSTSAGPAAPGIVSAPIPPRPNLTPDAQALLDAIARGLAPDADDATRAMTGEICARLAQIAGAQPAAVPAAVPTLAPPAASSHGFAPFTSVPPPASPIAAAARALRQLPPEQLLDLLLQRLRAALPAGAAVQAPSGIQFPLVPVTKPR
jgi:hypothetical protein